MNSIGRQSINRKLTLTVMLTTGVSLLLACITFAAYDVITLRRAMAQEATTLAEVIGINCAVALMFDDPQAATETLSALSAAERVTGAVVYDRDGEEFARYVPAVAADLAASSADFFEPDGHHFHQRSLDVQRKIVFLGEAIGAIHIRFDTRELITRVERYAALVVALLAAAGGVGALFSQRLRRQIARPLAGLVESSEAIAEGDLSTRVETTNRDEIGVLARTFNAMTVGLRDLVLEARRGIGGVSDVARDLQESGAQMSLEAQRQRDAIDETADSIERFGESIVEVNQNVEELADSARESSSSILEMDAAIGEIARHMDHLTSSIDTTSTAVNQVAANIDQIVHGGDTLQSAMESTLIRLRQLSMSVRQVKDNAEASHNLTEDASEEAHRGMTVVGETIDAMGEIFSSFGQLEESVARLSNRSESIDAIIQVISEVAEQTSLLSLNAAIIAAQAGEHGKPFSVVADQVKNLAARTHRSTQEIAQHIRDVQKDTASAVAAVEAGSAKVEKGVQRSHVAGEVLKRIIEKSQTSAARVSEIVEATARQSGDLDRVDQALLEVREIVEQINGSTRDQQRATTEIATAVESIRALGKEVRRSSEEQRRGSRLITHAVTRVESMVNQIAEATHAQTKSSETIQHALQVFRDGTAETSRRAEAINAMVATLSERSLQLERKIGRFKTE